MGSEQEVFWKTPQKAHLVETQHLSASPNKNISSIAILLHCSQLPKGKHVNLLKQYRYMLHLYDSSRSYLVQLFFSFSVIVV